MHKSVKEFSVKTLEIGGFGAALQALRLPFGKEARSYVDGEFVRAGNYVTYNKSIDVSDKDISLLQALVRRGDEHAKVLRGICVWCDINAPLYLWKEFDTYKIGAERLSSESSMHIEGRGLSEDELITMQEEMPCGHMQKRVWMFSYQTLRRIYYQRFDHRLPQWRMFCEWIRTLPFAEELIVCDE